MTLGVGNVNVETSTGGGAVCFHLTGVIDERFEAGRMFEEAAPITIVNLEGVKRITSFGVRRWSEAMKALSPAVKHLYLVRCPPCFIDQLNMVLNFGGRSEIVTAIAVYFCDKCQEERQVPIDVLGDRSAIANGQLAPATCPVCNGPMQLEDDPQQFFRFAITYGAKSIEPAAASLLAQDQLYQAREEVGKPPEEVKLVHGEVTLFKLSGMLDARFRPRRLASGVEGHVVFDLANVAGVDEVGAKRWRQLLDALGGGPPVSMSGPAIPSISASGIAAMDDLSAPISTGEARTQAMSVVLVDLPEPLVAKVASGRFSIDGTALYSVRVTFRCPSCKNTMIGSITAGELPQVPARPCSRCGQPSTLSTGTSVLEIVFGLGRRLHAGAVSPAVLDMISHREELLSRARAEGGAVLPQAEGGLSRYRVIRPLSQGGMAEILLAVHQGIGGFEKLIALKKIRREMLERRHVAVELFLNEAKIAANLNHPNIVQIFEVGEHGGDLFIAMEYVHGVDLRDVMRQGLAQNKRLNLEQALFIGTQVASALSHAHQARDISGRSLNIVHRDVSLSNIVISFDGQVKLVDFGIATASVVERMNEGLVGKCSYMSPEQIRSQPLDGRSDVFSLGVVLHELLTGKTLFRRSKDEETLVAVLQGSIPPLADSVPSFVEQALLLALARERDQRYPNARAFELALEECQQRIGTTNSHQLAVYMKDLFGERSASPPGIEVKATAKPAAPARPTPAPVEASGGESSTSDSGKSQSYHIDIVPWEEEEEKTTIDSSSTTTSQKDLETINRSVKPTPAVVPRVPQAMVKTPASVPRSPQTAAAPATPAPALPATQLGTPAAAGLNDPAPKTSRLFVSVVVAVVVIGLLVAAGLIYTSLT